MTSEDDNSTNSGGSDSERHMSQPICYHENSTQLKQDCNK